MFVRWLKEQQMKLEVRLNKYSETVEQPARKSTEGLQSKVGSRVGKGERMRHLVKQTA